ncbi:MAG: dihydropteroate synthase [Paludibacteraceae bacterium]|nr:dihydropteroate synthase [Paludibacteraceae bacterium]
MKLNINGTLWDSNKPLVMGILNVTPDSFFADSRCQNENAILKRAEEIVNQGGKIIDIGGYSTRPGCEEVDEKEEIARVTNAVKLIKKEFPEVPLSIDTFRSNVAKIAVKDFGADIINDISGGNIDEKMFETVAELKVPYILMHMRGTPQNMNKDLNYSDLKKEIFTYFAERVNRLRLLGVNDIIIDPGFGFSKSMEQNYELMDDMELFATFKMPILVGISRKRMIWQLLDKNPQESLNGTTVLNTIALMKGASILRVHDVKEAAEAIKIVEKMKECSTTKSSSSFSFI